MKKRSALKTLTALFVLLMLITTGCGKDNNNPGNTFTYDGKTYDLTQGLIYSDTIVEGQVYNHLVFFFSDGFTIHYKEGTNVIDSISGRGEALLFVLFSSSMTIDNGVYYHLPSDKSLAIVVPDVFTWASGRFFINYSETDEGIVGEDHDLINGTITTKGTGTDKYEFKLNLIAEDGEEEKEVSGYINMQLHPITFENKKSLNLNNIF